MPSDLREPELREFLRRMAGEMPTPGEVPPVAISRARTKLAWTVVASVVAAAIALAGALGGVRALLLAEPNRPADDSKHEPIVAIPIDAGVPIDVAVGEGSVWVSGQGAFRIDPSTDRVVAAFPSTFDSALGGQSVAVGEGSVWVSGGAFDGEILRIDPGTNQIVATIHVGASEDPYALAVGAGSVWATSHSDAMLLRIDPATNAVETIDVPETITTGPGPGVHGVAVLDGRVWIQGSGYDDGNGDLFGMAADTPGSWDHIRVTVYDQIWAGFGSIWAFQRGGWIVRVDPTTGSDLARVRIRDVGSVENFRLAIGEGAVWVADGISIYRIDPVSNEVTASLRFRAPVEGLAAGAGAVWVADGIDTLYRVDLSAFEAVAGTRS